LKFDFRKNICLIQHIIKQQPRQKLPNAFIGALSLTKEPEHIERADIVRALESCLPTGREYERKLISKYWLTPVKHRDKEFIKLIVAVNRIAPKGYYFGEYHLLWGFWKKKRKK